MAEKFTHLAQLESLRDALVSEARKQEQAAADLRVREVTTLKAADEFRDHKRTPHPPIAYKRREDDQLVLVASVSDEFEIDTLLHTDDELSFRRPGVGPDVLRKLRRGEWVIQDEIDLHGCRTAKRASCSPVLCATRASADCAAFVSCTARGLGRKVVSRC